MSALLEAKSVTFAYETGKNVLQSVTVSVYGGRNTGIVGPNGSGKSTLLRILSGLLRPDEGTVTLDGKPLAALSGRQRARQIAFLPQIVNPTFALTVFEVVCLGRYPHAGAWGGLRPADFEVARRCLRETETAGLHNREFTSLSGGERQRVLLAGTLAQEPQLLLLDEPTSSLDIHHEVEVFALLRRLSREGYGIALVTHDLNLAAQYCDSLALLSGEHTVLAAGPPEEVLNETRLSEAYGAKILVASHPISGTPFVAARPDREPQT